MKTVADKHRPAAYKQSWQSFHRRGSAALC